MGLEQGGLAERVAVAAGQGNDVIDPSGGLEFLPQLTIGGGAAEEGLQGGVRHGQPAGEGLCILAGPRSQTGRLPLPFNYPERRIDAKGTLLP